MNVIMIVVASINGKTTRGNESDIYSWTSKEDQDLFFSLRDRAPLIVMGRKTFEAASDKIKLGPNNRRIVLTRNPEQFTSKTVPGQLEFTNEPPDNLVKRLENEGCKEILLVGGAEIDAAFLQAKLVDELHLTLEPLLFGKGKDLLTGVPFDVPLHLLEMKKLNEQGTLHLIYTLDRGQEKT